LDLHSNNALCGLMDESGRRLIHKQLPCDLAAILQMLKPYKKRIATIAVESTYNWYWLVDGLQDYGYHVVLANPARMQPYSGMKYTDDVSDAYLCASASLRLGVKTHASPAPRTNQKGLTGHGRGASCPRSQDGRKGQGLRALAFPGKRHKMTK